jgi:dimethylaniline monooxygenase (N-oxide forming)
VTVRTGGGRIAIIGAGAAGLASARALLTQGFDCTLFERATRLGGVWTIGYANFGTQVQRELYAFPDFPLPPEATDFAPGEVVQKYLEAYARHFSILPRIRFATRVTGITGGEGNVPWRVHSEHAGDTVEEDFDWVVVCVGLYSNVPHRPTFPGEADFKGEILHVSDVVDRVQLAGKRVIVVGFGKSASDSALESAAVAARTTMLYRKVHWPVPPYLLGVLPFKWAMLNRFTSTLVPLYYRPSALERAVHGVGRPLVWLWWRIVERLLMAQYGLGSRGGKRPDLVPDHPIELDGFGEAVMLPRPSFYPALHSGAIEPVQGSIAAFGEQAVRLDDGRLIEADVVVLATGWETDYSFLPQTLQPRVAEDGIFLYRQMLHPDAPRLAFIGHAASISSLLTYSLQAAWFATLLTGRHELPDAADMRADVAALTAWKRRAIPDGRGRSARLLLHMQHYHDQLLTDLGLDAWRKRGAFAPFKEVFAPYEPGDYQGLFDELGMASSANR